jgi:hypothetical protein
VLVVILYFTLSSQWFITSQVLPRVSRAAGTLVTADRVFFSPFSALELYGVQAGEGQRPLVRLGTVRCRYSLWAIMHGDLVVTEFQLTDAKTLPGRRRRNLPCRRPPRLSRRPRPPAASKAVCGLTS